MWQHDVRAVRLSAWSVVPGSVASDPPSQLHVLITEGHSLGVDAAKVGIFEETYEVSLSCLLHCHQGLSLEAYLVVDLLGDLAHDSLEGGSGQEKFG